MYNTTLCRLNSYRYILYHSLYNHIHLPTLYLVVHLRGLCYVSPLLSVHSISSLLPPLTSNLLLFLFLSFSASWFWASIFSFHFRSPCQYRIWRVFTVVLFKQGPAWLYSSNVRNQRRCNETVQPGSEIQVRNVLICNTWFMN